MDRRYDRFFNPTRDHRLDDDSQSYEIHAGEQVFDDRTGYRHRSAGRYGMDRDFNRGPGASGHTNFHTGRVGPFSGLGPKGYRRSDERIHDDVCESLSVHPEIDASDVEVEVKDRIVRLRGTVGTRWMKRMMEDAVDQVSGVEDVFNEAKVRSDAVRPPFADLMGFEENETGWDTDGLSAPFAPDAPEVQAPRALEEQGASGKGSGTRAGAPSRAETKKNPTTDPARDRRRRKR